MTTRTDKLTTTRVIHEQITLNAPPEKVYQLWTTEQGLISFFAPECKIEIKPLGAFEMYFLLNNKYGDKGSEGCKVLSFVPNRMLSFTWNAPPHLPLARKELSTVVVIFFHDAGNNKTNLELFNHGYPEGGEFDLALEYFKKAWVNVLESLRIKINT